MPVAADRAPERSPEAMRPAGAVCRVLHVVLSLNPGGTERLVVALVERLSGFVDAAVCCIDEIGAWGATLRRAGVPVTALTRRPGFRPQLGLEIARLARAHRADVIHCHHYSPLVYAAVSRLFHRAPRIVFTEHGRLASAPPSAKRRVANFVVARVPDAAFAVSEDLKRHLVSEGFDSGSVNVLHNGIDPGPPASPQARNDARRTLGVAPGACVIATVARLDPVKDLTSLVDAFRLVREQRLDARLVIVGEGPERTSIETLVARHGLAPAITLLGHREDARQLLAGVDIYVNCSTFEGISLTILEAMAAALPVVATHVGGNPEIVDASTGRLVPPRDPASLAAALIALADAPALRTELGLAARARIERDFSLDRMVGEYLHVYRSVTPCAASQA